MKKLQRATTDHDPNAPGSESIQEHLLASFFLWRPIRGPFERWPHLIDILVSLIAFVLNLLMWSNDHGQAPSVSAILPYSAAYLGVFLASVALLWRRTHPWQVHAVIVGIAILLFVAAPVDGVVPLGFSLYALGRYEASKLATAGGALVAFIFVGVDLWVFGDPSVGSMISAMMVLALWYLGRRLRFRGEYLRLLEERAQHLDRERTADSERAVAAERTRIARELHDIVAHQISLMTVQAGAARTILRTDPTGAREAMASVESAGRHALAEMRQMLGVLRPVNTGAVLDPQPGIGDLPKLVEKVSELGLDVQLQKTGDLSGLPAGLELTIYRIVQEALTNVIKHADGATQVVVDIEGRAEDLLIIIKDDAKSVSFDHTKRGHGVVGMRERAQLLGGSLSAGAGIHSGFEVHAVLPRKPKEQF